jgi:G3E family GTPase
MLAKTPVTIVTGFLGSGKTTLIRHVLTHAHGRRLALIVNEFGDSALHNPGHVRRFRGGDGPASAP